MQGTPAFHRRGVAAQTRSQVQIASSLKELERQLVLPRDERHENFDYTIDGIDLSPSAPLEPDLPFDTDFDQGGPVETSDLDLTISNDAAMYEDSDEESDSEDHSDHNMDDLLEEVRDLANEQIKINKEDGSAEELLARLRQETGRARRQAKPPLLRIGQMLRLQKEAARFGVLLARCATMELHELPVVQAMDTVQSLTQASATGKTKVPAWLQKKLDLHALHKALHSRNVRRRRDALDKCEKGVLADVANKAMRQVLKTRQRSKLATAEALGLPVHKAPSVLDSAEINRFIRLKQSLKALSAITKNKPHCPQYDVKRLQNASICSDLDVVGDRLPRLDLATKFDRAFRDEWGVLESDTDSETDTDVEGDEDTKGIREDDSDSRADELPWVETPITKECYQGNFGTDAFACHRRAHRRALRFTSQFYAGKKQVPRSVFHARYLAHLRHALQQEAKARLVAEAGRIEVNTRTLIQVPAKPKEIADVADSAEAEEVVDMRALLAQDDLADDDNDEEYSVVLLDHDDADTDCSDNDTDLPSWETKEGGKADAALQCLLNGAKCAAKFLRRREEPELRSCKSLQTLSDRIRKERTAAEPSANFYDVVLTRVLHNMERMSPPGRRSRVARYLEFAPRGARKVFVPAEDDLLDLALIVFRRERRRALQMNEVQDMQFTRKTPTLPFDIAACRDRLLPHRDLRNLRNRYNYNLQVENEKAKFMEDPSSVSVDQMAAHRQLAHHVLRRFGMRPADLCTLRSRRLRRNKHVFDEHVLVKLGKARADMALVGRSWKEALAHREIQLDPEHARDVFTRYLLPRLSKLEANMELFGVSGNDEEATALTSASTGEPSPKRRRLSCSAQDLHMRGLSDKSNHHQHQKNDENSREFVARSLTLPGTIQHMETLPMSKRKETADLRACPQQHEGQQLTLDGHLTLNLSNAAVAENMFDHLHANANVTLAASPTRFAFESDSESSSDDDESSASSTDGAHSHTAFRPFGDRNSDPDGRQRRPNKAKETAGDRRNDFGAFLTRVEGDRELLSSRSRSRSLHEPETLIDGSSLSRQVSSMHPEDRRQLEDTVGRFGSDLMNWPRRTNELVDRLGGEDRMQMIIKRLFPAR
ncbi:MAG: hypothetical protein MHM6MM_004784 [Cercozoa sp. M6MM]